MGVLPAGAAIETMYNNFSIGRNIITEDGAVINISPSTFSHTIKQTVASLNERAVGQFPIGYAAETMQHSFTISRNIVAENYAVVIKGSAPTGQAIKQTIACLNERALRIN